jgi:predicted dehydrogenase
LRFGVRYGSLRWMTKKLRIGVVGVGHIGSNHARLYAEIPSAEFTAVFDIDAGRGAAIARKYGAAAASSLGEFADLVDAASIATPTSSHYEVARHLLHAGKHLLVEKPITENTKEASDLANLAVTKNLILQVGHVERFNPVLSALEARLTHPRFIEAHRLSPYPDRSTDIGVVLDLMIHDLDVVLSFVNVPVREIRAVGLPILSGKVDIANVRMEFDSGCVANFTASRVSTERVRKLRFFQPRQYISLDYSRQDVLAFSIGDDGEAAGMPSVNPQIKVNKPEVIAEEPLQAELKAFLASVRRRSKPLVSLEDGRRALGVALDIVAAIREHGKKVKLDRLGAMG